MFDRILNEIHNCGAAELLQRTKAEVACDVEKSIFCLFLKRQLFELKLIKEH